MAASGGEEARRNHLKVYWIRRESEPFLNGLPQGCTREPYLIITIPGIPVTKAYIAKKNELNNHLAPFYNEYIFRKLKLGSYIRRQITESRLLKRFKTLFGSGKETIVAMIGSISIENLKSLSKVRASERCFARQAMRCIWLMSFVLAVAVARVMESVRRFGYVRTRDPIEVVLSCVMGLSSVRLVQGYGTEIRMLLQTYGRLL